MDGSVSRLLTLMEAGDMRALDELARSYGARLLRLARRTCRRPSDAEDAVQQALLIAGAELKTFRGDGSPLSWLSTLVARSCYRLNERMDLERPSGLELGDNEAVPEEDASIAGLVSAALMNVSRTDRLAFLLSVEGLTAVEIAAQFGLSHDAIRSRLKRVRKVLRAALTDDTVAPRPDTKEHALRLALGSHR